MRGTSLRPPGRHVVLASTDAEPFASLRSRPLPREERRRIGKRLRKDVPRSALGRWEPPADRVDPLELIARSHEGRIPWLVPVRFGRMAASPYGFLRGTAIVMAEDFALLPSTNIQPVICGDAHVGNIGFYASPERTLVLDLNDFDEAHPGSWEWDLRRLATSVWVAGRENGASEGECEAAARACSAAYRAHMRELYDQPLFLRSFEELDLERLKDTASEKSLTRQIERSAKRAQRRTSDRALPRFTEVFDGYRRIVEEPPLITRPSDLEFEDVAAGLDDYLGTLEPHWQRVLGGYTLVDIVHKVVGVGSVGLRAYIALLEGSGPNDVIFLQLKQARRSVIARHVHGESAWHAHQGQRVVEYQRALQTVSDPLLGWTTVRGHQYYVRQFRNMKGTIPLDAIDADALTDYAGICAQLLAKGHARTSGASLIVGYLGKSEKFDGHLARFAKAYADQTEADHAALVAAVRRGDVPAEHGI